MGEGPWDLSPHHNTPSLGTPIVSKSPSLVGLGTLVMVAV